MITTLTSNALQLGYVIVISLTTIMYDIQEYVNWHILVTSKIWIPNSL